MQLAAPTPVKLKPVAIPPASHWRQFNQFSRRPQAPHLTLRPLANDPDTAIVSVAGKSVGTINRRPHGWYALAAITGERATLEKLDVEGVLVRLVWDECTMAEAMAAQTDTDEFLAGL